jgi:hypothetical protein
MIHFIAYNIKKRTVGCVLIQAALGGTVPPDLFNQLFPSERWDTSMEGMQLYPATDEQLEKLASRAKTP